MYLREQIKNQRNREWTPNGLHFYLVLATQAQSMKERLREAAVFWVLMDIHLVLKDNILPMMIIRYFHHQRPAVGQALEEIRDEAFDFA